MKSIKDRLTKELLLSISKPARYIGGEVNSVKKDLSQTAVNVCLCFPDVYEVGMSHLGLRILYDLINRYQDFAAERVFSPWVDMEDKLRNENIPLFSLESSIPVKDFDILGFSLQYELSYTNVLNILSLAEIPLESHKRTMEHPLVIAGGICALNPEPMSSFIDLFFIGEAEEAIIEILDIYKELKKNPNCSREEILRALSVVEGVYIPSFYHIEEQTQRRITLYPGAPERIKKRYIRDLNKIGNIERWIVPYIEIVHDRVGLEILRGCPNNCRFCQARNYFYPFRVLNKDSIIDAVLKNYQRTGYEEVSLLSLSSSDHPDLGAMVGCLLDNLRSNGVSISLPSLRAKSQIGEISRILSVSKKTTLTFAPEAGSERLRKLINKNLDVNELFSVIQEAYRAGYRLLKLYFMIGLPTETYQDLDDIVELCAKISKMKREVDGHPAHLNISISNFVPKPHTPFQWQAMDSSQVLSEKQEYLKKAFYRLRGVMHLKFHSTQMSFLEGVLTRGDRRLGDVIKSAFEKGAKFDSWREFFNYPLWMEAFSSCHVDFEDYFLLKPYGDVLNWSFVDLGIGCEVLRKEAQCAFLASDICGNDLKSVDPGVNLC
ncbi:MAG: TIGR03960 family B12-binding radical SAM protein [Candidatus Omnitrophota bacterium]